MSEYYHDDTPPRPLNWTLASESQIKKLPNKEELWEEWRKNKTWDYSGMPLPVSKINTLKLIENEQL